MNLDQALEHARAVGLSDRDIARVVREEADRVRFRQLGDNVLMMHPNLDGREVPVHPDAVEQHEAAGWVVKPADDITEPAEPAVPADKPKTVRSSKS